MTFSLRGYACIVRLVGILDPRREQRLGIGESG